MFFFVFYVFFSLSPTIQGTLGKGESRPVRTSTSNSSRFLRRPSDYCSDITSMVSSLNRIFHLNHFKDFYTHDTLTNDADYAILDFSLAYDSGKTCILQQLFIYLFIYLFINYLKRLNVAFKVFQEYQKSVNYSQYDLNL